MQFSFNSAVTNIYAILDFSYVRNYYLARVLTTGVPHEYLLHMIDFRIIEIGDVRGGDTAAYNRIGAGESDIAVEERCFVAVPRGRYTHAESSLAQGRRARTTERPYHNGHQWHAVYRRPALQ